MILTDASHFRAEVKKLTGIKCSNRATLRVQFSRLNNVLYESRVYKIRRFADLAELLL